MSNPVTATVLIIDADREFAASLAGVLRDEGYGVHAAHGLEGGRARLFEVYPDVVLLDPALPEGSGRGLVGEIRSQFPDARVVVLSGDDSVATVVETTRAGAADYLAKPADPRRVALAVRKAVEEATLDERARRMRRLTETPLARGGEAERVVFYASPAMLQVMSVALRVARQEGNALLLGESGTGKDRLARWIHRHSKRADGPFFSINCAALPRELAESELFGHEPGAFTGTRGRRRGLLELAHGGSVLLNEIGELELPLQSKLLEFLDHKSFLRVGGERTVTVDARIMAATNRDLKREVTRGAFRGDLFYRLNVVPIRLPPLRERVEDLPVLVEEMLDRLTAEMGLAVRPVVDPEAMELVRGYRWPGNVRELRNVLERAVILSSDGRIGPEQLVLDSAGSSPTSPPPPPAATAATEGEFRIVVPFPRGRSLPEVTRDVARQLLVEALRRARTRNEAAELLGITRHAFNHHAKVLGVDG